MIFLHRYSLAIGWPVPLLKKIMSARDISEAIAYSRIEPWGEEREDFRAGIVASTIANVNRASNSKPFTPRDFMPDFSRKPETKAEKLKRQVLEVFKIGNNSKPSN